MGKAHAARQVEHVRVDVGTAVLPGDLSLPAQTSAIILFAHGSGSSRHSPRNRFVAERLDDAGFGTLLIDLLTAQEEMDDLHSGHIRFNITLLAERLAGILDWLRRQKATEMFAIGLFGASTGGGAALVAAAERPDAVGAIVSRGGRPDLAGEALQRVYAPTLLIVGQLDNVVIELNQRALRQIACSQKELSIVPNASHLFEEAGALEQVAALATQWFQSHLGSA